MREKKVSEKTIEKYIAFLMEVQKFDYESGTTLSQLIKDYNINKTIKKCLIDLAIINYHRDNYWIWISYFPDRKLALTVLEYLLERSKKQRTTPIAGMENLVTAIKHNTEALARFSGLNRLKTSDTVKDVELFTIDSQRLQVASSIASEIYKNAFEYNYDGDAQMIEKASKFIVLATDDLIKRLLNKA